MKYTSWDQKRTSVLVQMQIYMFALLMFTFILVNDFWSPDISFKGLVDERNGITITGVTLHSHKNATSVTLRHIRRGRELRPIMSEPNFDFNNQEMVVLQEPVQIRPVSKQG